ncbi:MAG: hypothetical protein ACI8W7_002661 [Gammaproteobacteria bacterium]
MKIDARHLRRAISLVTVFMFLGLAGVNSHAQLYAVEMIIFADTSEEHLAAEVWRADPGQPDVSRAASILDASDVSAINSSAYRLSGIWQVLRNSSQYRPLRHLAWTQRGRSKRSAPEILVGESSDSDVFGTLRMSRTRFLHLELDLLLRNGERSFRLTNHRRMRSNQLNYIDHPLFGVLVIATPVQ